MKLWYHMFIGYKLLKITLTAEYMRFCKQLIQAYYLKGYVMKKANPATLLTIGHLKDIDFTHNVDPDNGEIVSVVGGNVHHEEMIHSYVRIRATKAADISIDEVYGNYVEISIHATGSVFIDEVSGKRVHIFAKGSGQVYIKSLTSEYFQVNSRATGGITIENINCDKVVALMGKTGSLVIENGDMRDFGYKCWDLAHVTDKTRVATASPNTAQYALVATK